MDEFIERMRDLRSEIDESTLRKNAILKKLQEHRSTIESGELAKLKSEARSINEAIEKNQAEIDGLQKRNTKKFEGEFIMENVQKNDEIEKRAQLLRSGGVAHIESRSVTSKQAAMSVLASPTINPAFSQISTLDQLVKVVHMNGGESYKSAFLKTTGEGGVTTEGSAYTAAEPVFDYVEINKVKLTAYAEITEEISKLPNADYDASIQDSVLTALRRKKIQQIIEGSGTGEFVGIINASTKIIDDKQTKAIASLSESFLDDIIYHYGGDEDVEGDAYLIINKLTLGQLAKIRGTENKRKVFDIKVNGNTGTIDNIPVIFTSKLPAYSSTLTKSQPYAIYGKLTAYEVAEFGDIEVSRSADYKFKEGMVAYKVSQMCGGSPAMYNGFMKIVRTIV